MVDNKFWKIVKKFNFLMKTAIVGPNCIDICNGDCCSIKIDVPKILAKEYIKRGYAVKSDFIRSDVFSFKLRFDEGTSKCFLYDKKINGCRVHSSEIKPPQCWIYPTNFSNPGKKDLSCKKANGWDIIDSKKTKEAEELLNYYVFLCQLEAKKESKSILERVSNSLSNGTLKDLLKNTPPSQFSGFKDGWDNFAILKAEGISLQLKKICLKENTSCELILHNEYLKCKSICDKVSEWVTHFLQQNIYNYVNKRGVDIDGEYLFNELDLNR
ncbi:MAG: hypothetical protein ACFFA0_08785 [Promethearchaeota archaeon]